MVKHKLAIIFFIFVICLPGRAAFAQDIQRVKAYFLNGDYRSAINEGEKLLSKDIDKQHSDELYYFLGLSYLKEGNYLRSSDIFAIIISEFKDSRFKDDAKLGLGDTYLLKGELDQAQNHYLDLLKNKPDTKLKAQLYLRLSKIAYKKGDTAAGKAYAEKLSTEMPFSPEAIKDMANLLDGAKGNVCYSVQVGSFSSATNANNLSSILNKNGYPAFVEEGSSRTSDKIYRVKVGRFSSRQEADATNEKLIRQGYPTKITP